MPLTLTKIVDPLTKNLKKSIGLSINPRLGRSAAFNLEGKKCHSLESLNCSMIASRFATKIGWKSFRSVQNAQQNTSRVKPKIRLINIKI